VTATLTDIAQAVADELNAETWSLSFTAERKHVVQVRLDDLSDLLVYVVPRATETKQLTRASNVTAVGIDVGVLVKLGDIENPDVDPYVALIDEIVNHFHATRLDDVVGAVCVATRPDPVYDTEKLENRRAFVSVIRMEFRFYP